MELERQFSPDANREQPRKPCPIPKWRVNHVNAMIISLAPFGIVLRHTGQFAVNRIKNAHAPCRQNAPTELGGHEGVKGADHQYEAKCRHHIGGQFQVGAKARHMEGGDGPQIFGEKVGHAFVGARIKRPFNLFHGHFIQGINKALRGFAQNLVIKRTHISQAHFIGQTVNHLTCRAAGKLFNITCGQAGRNKAPPVIHNKRVGLIIGQQLTHEGGLDHKISRQSHHSPIIRRYVSSGPERHFHAGKRALDALIHAHAPKAGVIFTNDSACNHDVPYALMRSTKVLNTGCCFANSRTLLKQISAFCLSPVSW